MNGAVFEQSRKFGVEFEIVGISPPVAVRAIANSTAEHTVYQESYNHATREHWKVTSDNSLRYRDLSRTAEVVSPPLSGSAGIQEVRSVLLALRSAGAKVNRSCGFHVHWDCRDYLSPNRVRDLLYLYAKFEPVIDSLVSMSRRGNASRYAESLCFSNSAEPNSEGMEWISRLGRELGRNSSARELIYAFNGRTMTRSNRRFYKINITSYLSYGTIEFRQHQGTLSFSKARAWILLTQCLATRPLRGVVKHSPTSKLSLGEFFRTLKVADHHTEDPDIRWMRDYLKRRQRELTAIGASEEGENEG